MQKEFDLKKRTMAFALDVAAFCETLPNNYRGWIVQKQLLRAGTGTGANYRAACRRKSTPDFISKMGTALEEADESDFWLEFSAAAGLTKPERVRSLQKEAQELIDIFTASIGTARARLKKERGGDPPGFTYDIPD